MMHTYPTYDELCATGFPPQPLWIGTHEQLQAFGAKAGTYSAPIYTRSEPDPKPEKRNHNKKPGSAPRTFASQYVGVSVHREDWYMAGWTVSGTPKRGRLRPRTPDGERWAAQDRARALGLDYLELRDGTRIPYRQWESEEIAA